MGLFLYRLDRIPNSRVIAVDQDPLAFTRAQEMAKIYGAHRLTAIRGKVIELMALMELIVFMQFGDLIRLLEKRLDIT
jgi:hypothetical protein